MFSALVCPSDRQWLAFSGHSGWWQRPLETQKTSFRTVSVYPHYKFSLAGAFTSHEYVTNDTNTENCWLVEHLQCLLFDLHRADAAATTTVPVTVFLLLFHLQPVCYSSSNGYQAVGWCALFKMWYWQPHFHNDFIHIVVCGCWGVHRTSASTNAPT